MFANFQFARRMLGKAMLSFPSTRLKLKDDLHALGLREGDGVFVHSSMRAIGPVVGGPRAVIEALLDVLGEGGLVGMPGFSTDAYFPADVDRSCLTDEEVMQIEEAVTGFDLAKSPTDGMGVIAELFRTWPGTFRSDHPSTSVCLNGSDAKRLVSEHSLPWAMGADTPFGKMMHRPDMKVLLIGVGWNRCTPLHTAETFSDPRRTKTRRFKKGGKWSEETDVADDLNRLFPKVGDAFEKEGLVSEGTLGAATCKLCGYKALVEFASDWISAANLASGDRT